MSTLFTSTSWRAILLVLLVALLACAALACWGCGESPLTECEEICLNSREQLIKTYGFAEDEVDCSDQMWRGSCVYCEELLRQEFKVQLAQSCSQL